MKAYVEVNVLTYTVKEITKYFEKGEDPKEGDEWKTLIEDNNQVPHAYISRCRINPDKILSYTETFSIDQLHILNQGEEPSFDVVELSMEDGLTMILQGTLEEFQSKLDNYYNS